MLLAMPRFKTTRVFLPILFLFAISCGTSPHLSKDPFGYLSEKTWIVTSIHGIGDLGSIYGTDIPYLQFESDGITSGFTGCNNLIGAVASFEDGFSIKRGATTRRSCDGDGEKIFLEALGDVNTVRIKEEELIMINGTQEIMVFSVLQPTH